MTTGPNQTRQNTRTRLLVNPLFLKQPDQYYHYVLQWFMYPKWTIEEAANLLVGCVPHRKLFLKGAENQVLDEEVVQVENRIRRAIGKELQVQKSKKYFSTSYVDREALLKWARASGMAIPYQLLKAKKAHEQHTEIHGYTTPCLEALQWIVASFWEHADLREPPAPGEIVQALLGEFPELTAEECDWIEHIARHPLARSAQEEPPEPR